MDDAASSELHSHCETIAAVNILPLSGKSTTQNHLTAHDMSSDHRNVTIGDRYEHELFAT